MACSEPNCTRSQIAIQDSTNDPPAHIKPSQLLQGLPGHLTVAPSFPFHTHAMYNRASVHSKFLCKHCGHPMHNHPGGWGAFMQKPCPWADLQEQCPCCKQYGRGGRGRVRKQDPFMRQDASARACAKAAQQLTHSAAVLLPTACCVSHSKPFRCQACVSRHTQVPTGERYIYSNAQPTHCVAHPRAAHRNTQQLALHSAQVGNSCFNRNRTRRCTTTAAATNRAGPKGALEIQA